MLHVACFKHHRAALASHQIGNISEFCGQIFLNFSNLNRNAVYISNLHCISYTHVFQPRNAHTYFSHSTVRRGWKHCMIAVSNFATLGTGLEIKQHVLSPTNALHTDAILATLVGVTQNEPISHVSNIRNDDAKIGAG